MYFLVSTNNPPSTSVWLSRYCVYNASHGSKTHFLRKHDQAEAFVAIVHRFFGLAYRKQNAIIYRTLSELLLLILSRSIVLWRTRPNQRLRRLLRRSDCELIIIVMWMKAKVRWSHRSFPNCPAHVAKKNSIEATREPFVGLFVEGSGVA